MFSLAGVTHAPPRRPARSSAVAVTLEAVYPRGMRTSVLTSGRIRGLSLFAGVGVALATQPALADVDLAPVVQIDLSAFDGSGFDPEPAAGQLDSDDWSVQLSGSSVLDFGGTAGGAGSDYARGLSTGNVDDPGVWAFDIDGAGTIAFGIQPTDLAFTPGRVVLRLVNNTGADITDVQVEYTLWVNNDVGRSSTVSLEHSADNMAYTAIGEPIVTPMAADRDGFVGTDVVEVITPETPIPDGGVYYISWSGDDAGGAGPARDELGIEGITFRLLDVCGNGLMDKGEECDDGLMNADTAACTSTCTTAVCGDGLVQEGVEECDDMNTDPGDGCAADCTVEVDPGTSSGSDGGTTAADSGSASASASGADTSGGDASASASATASATAGSDDSGGGSDEGTGGEDDGSGGCVCNSSGGGNPLWAAFGAFGLALLRRRRH